MPVALDSSSPATDGSALGRRLRRRPRRRWFDVLDDPVLLCECADGDHTC